MCEARELGGGGNDLRRWKVWKFGGSSVASARQILKVANLASTEMNRVSSQCSDAQCLAIVVSAMAGVTDLLKSCCDDAARMFHKSRARPLSGGEPSYSRALATLKMRHTDALDELEAWGEMDPDFARRTRAALELDLTHCAEVLRAFCHSGASLVALRQLVMGYGELWSSRILFGAIQHRCAPLIESTARQKKKFSARGADRVDDSTPRALSSNLAMHHQRGKASHYPDIHDDLRSELSQAFLHLESEEAPDPARENERWTAERAAPTGVGACCFCREDCRANCDTRVVLWLDARDILILKRQPGAAHCEETVVAPVRLDDYQSASNMNLWLESHPKARLTVVTGYICSNSDNTFGTLGRNGSDYSGSLVANLLSAESYTVWTDVDGIYTADPARVPEARRMASLSYIEAIELAYFGAKVLHPLTMAPCITRQIPIVLRATDLGRSSEGTVIFEQPKDCVAPRGVGGCKAFTLIDGVSLVNVTGTTMLGVPGIASRVFGAVHAAGCSVIMISQASSEHSICFAVASAEAAAVREAVDDAFYREMRADVNGMRVAVTDDCSIICAVGEGMCGNIGVMGRLATAVANTGVSIKAIAQGSSECNITLVVAASGAAAALRAMHASVYGPAKPRGAAVHGQHSRSWSSPCPSFRRRAVLPSAFTRAPTVAAPTSAGSSHRRCCSLLAGHLTAAGSADAVHLVLLVDSIPLPSSAELAVSRFLSNLRRQRPALPPRRRSKCRPPRSFAARANGPDERNTTLELLVQGFTDGIITVPDPRAVALGEHVTVPPPTVRSLITEIRNAGMWVVIADLRQQQEDDTTTPGSLSGNECLRRQQTRFLDHCMRNGLVVLDRRGVQISPDLSLVTQLLRGTATQEAALPDPITAPQTKIGPPQHMPQSAQVTTDADADDGRRRSSPGSPYSASLDGDWNEISEFVILAEEIARQRVQFCGRRRRLRYKRRRPPAVCATDQSDLSASEYPNGHPVRSSSLSSVSSSCLSTKSYIASNERDRRAIAAFHGDLRRSTHG